MGLHSPLLSYLPERNAAQVITYGIQQKKLRSTILVVEDTEALRYCYVEYLRLSGFDVVAAENGMIALDILATQTIDLIIMDVFMPVLDGLSTLARIRSNSDIPVIMLSSATDDLLLAKLQYFGIYEFIDKSRPLGKLLASIEQVLNERHLSD